MIVVMAKVPSPGTAKTRLIPTLGPDHAAGLAAAMARDVFEMVAATGLPWRVMVAGDLSHPWVARLPTGWAPQPAGDLGVRLTQALWDGGIAIGTDAPLLDPSLLHAAHRRPTPVFLATADDGGYTLVGADAAAVRAGLFDGVPWSTPRTCAGQVARAEALGLAVTVVPGGYDVDDAHALTRLRADLHAAPLRAPSTRSYLASL